MKLNLKLKYNESKYHGEIVITCRRFYFIEEWKQITCLLYIFLTQFQPLKVEFTDFALIAEARIAELTEKYILTLRMTTVDVKWEKLTITSGSLAESDLTPQLLADWLQNKLNNDLFPIFDVWIEHYK